MRPENIICTIPTHTATGELYADVEYAYMRRQGTHRAPSSAVCIRSVCVLTKRLLKKKNE